MAFDDNAGQWGRRPRWKIKMACNGDDGGGHSMVVTAFYSGCGGQRGGHRRNNQIEAAVAAVGAVGGNSEH